MHRSSSGLINDRLKKNLFKKPMIDEQGSQGDIQQKSRVSRNSSMKRFPTEKTIVVRDECHIYYTIGAKSPKTAS
jgi:hypothetical protein